jgi:hypothetical protein
MERNGALLAAGRDVGFRLLAFFAVMVLLAAVALQARSIQHERNQSE